MSVGAHWTHIVMRATQSKSQDTTEDVFLTDAIERLAQIVFQGVTHSSSRSVLESARIGNDWTRVLVEAAASVPPNPTELLRFRSAVQSVCEVLFGSITGPSSSNASHSSADAAASTKGHSQPLQEEGNGDVDLSNSQPGSSAVMGTYNPTLQQPTGEAARTDIQVNPTPTVPAEAGSDTETTRSLTTTIPPSALSAPSAIPAADYFLNGGPSYTNPTSELNAFSLPDNAFDVFSYGNAFFGGVAPTQLELNPKTSFAATDWPPQTRTVLAPLQDTSTQEAGVHDGDGLGTTQTTVVGHSPESAKHPPPSTQSTPSKVKSTASQKGKHIKRSPVKPRKRKNLIASAAMTPNKSGNDALQTVIQTPRAGCKRTADRPANMASGAHHVVKMLRAKEALDEQVQVSQICRIMQYRVGKKDEFLIKNRRELFHPSARKYLSRSHMMLLDLSRFIHFGCRRETIQGKDGLEYRTWIFLPDSANAYYEQEQELLGWDPTMDLFYEEDDEGASMNDDGAGTEEKGPGKMLNAGLLPQ
ncbi:hypothetical protein CF319_g4494 [Tilletia indica]|nr:hypothetical protein CF319_g4494 [Tilletia indica]